MPVSTWFTRSVAWSPQLSLFVAMGDNPEVMYSSNGVSWTFRDLRTADGIVSASWVSLVWVPSARGRGGMFVAASAEGRVMISRNGFSWSMIFPPRLKPTALVGFAWSRELERLVAFGLEAPDRFPALTRLPLEFDDSTEFVVPDVDPPAPHLTSYIRALP